MSMSASLLNTESQGDDVVEEDLDHILTSLRFMLCLALRSAQRGSPIALGKGQA